ncbi:MAG: Grx4 family monothiol glutaredoxin [Pseudomonadota bacterium]
MSQDLNQEVQDHLRKRVATTDVVLFMKGTPQFPQCGFSSQVVQVLDYVGVQYDAVNVLDDLSVREGIKQFSNWPTIPQLYVKGEFVGGCDIIREMFQEGELTALLDQKGIAHARGGSAVA